MGWLSMVASERKGRKRWRQHGKEERVSNDSGERREVSSEVGMGSLGFSC